MREVLYSSRSWQRWLQMLFIGGNPGDGAGAGFTLRTVWGWYGLRENITSPWAGLLCHPAIPAAHSRARWQRKFPELSTCNVTLITQWDKQKGGYWSHWLSLVGCLSISLVYLFIFLFFSFFVSPSKSELHNTKQAAEGQASRFQLPARLNTSVRTCQEQLKYRKRFPWQQLCHFAICMCPTGEKEATPLSPPSGSLLTSLFGRNCPTRAEQPNGLWSFH